MARALHTAHTPARGNSSCSFAICGHCLVLQMGALPPAGTRPPLECTTSACSCLFGEYVPRVTSTGTSSDNRSLAMTQASNGRSPHRQTTASKYSVQTSGSHLLPRHLDKACSIQALLKAHK